MCGIVFDLVLWAPREVVRFADVAVEELRSRFVDGPGGEIVRRRAGLKAGMVSRSRPEWGRDHGLRSDSNVRTDGRHRDRPGQNASIPSEKPVRGP